MVGVAHRRHLDTRDGREWREWQVLAAMGSTSARTKSNASAKALDPSTVQIDLSYRIWEKSGVKEKGKEEECHTGGAAAAGGEAARNPSRSIL